MVEEELDAARDGSAGRPVGDAGTASETEVSHFVPDDKCWDEVLPRHLCPPGFHDSGDEPRSQRATVVKQIPDCGSIEENPYQTRYCFEDHENAGRIGGFDQGQRGATADRGASGGERKVATS